MTKAIDAFFSSQRSLKAVLDYVMVIMTSFNGKLWSSLVKTAFVILSSCEPLQNG